MPSASRGYQLQQHDPSGQDDHAGQREDDRTPLICLVGLPGSGKSAVGRRLAMRLGRPFLDTDEVIASRLDCSIREYFEREGEASFRDLEESVIHELAQSFRGVLATGGGAVLRDNNRRCLHTHGHVIYLRARLEDLFHRLRHDTQRPLLQVPDPMARLRDLQRLRDPLYRETAHTVIDTGRLTLAVVVTRLVTQLELSGFISTAGPNIP